MHCSYEQVSFPVPALSVIDDELMTLRGSQLLIDYCANAARAAPPAV